jgi:hypothetical protein
MLPRGIGGPKLSQSPTSRITTVFRAVPVFPNGRIRPSRLPSETGWTERTWHLLLIRYYNRASATRLPAL